MRRLRRGLGALAVIVVLGAAAVPGAAASSSYVPVDHWAYRALARFAALGLVPSYLIAARPLTVDEIGRVVRTLASAPAAQRLGPTDRATLQTLLLLFGDAEGAAGTTPSVTAQVAAGGGSPPTLTTPPGARVGAGAFVEVAAGTGVGLDARVGIQVPAAPVGAVTRLSGSVASGPFRLQVGREFLQWGPAVRGALLVSDNAGPLDLVKLTWDSAVPALRFTKFAAALRFPDRYLVGTRLDWMPFPRFRIGFSETAIASPSPIFWYHLVNPVPILVTNVLSIWKRQRELGANDNFLVSVDGDFLVRPGLWLYGDAMYDDIHSPSPFLEGIVFFPRRPSRWAYQVGMYLAGPPGDERTAVRIEYARIYNWTYTHALASRRYSLRGMSLGHWLGPDADDLVLMFERALRPGERVEKWVALTRHGEGRLTSKGLVGDPAWARRFLSGVVETRYSAGIAWQRVSAHTALTVGAELAYVQNRMNVSGQTGIGFFLGAAYRVTW